MKKGFKFNYTLKVLLRPCCGRSTYRVKSVNYMSSDRAYQEFLYYMDVCEDCVCALLYRNRDNAIIRFSGDYDFGVCVLGR